MSPAEVANLIVEGTGPVMERLAKRIDTSARQMDLLEQRLAEVERQLYVAAQSKHPAGDDDGQ